MSLPYDYYPAVLFALDRISEGYTRTEACDKANIGINTFEHYIEKDMMLQAMLGVAERRGNDALADALLTIDKHKKHGVTDPKMAKIISDNIKWVLDKRDRKRFGDRQGIDINMTADKHIVAALSNGRRRAAIAAGSSLPVMDAAFEEMISPEDEEAMYR